MGKDTKKKRVILWYTAVVCLSICLYAAIFLSSLNITLHRYSSLRPYCYYIPIIIICMVLIPSLFKGSRQPKALCYFAFSSVACLAMAPTLLHIAMFLDNGFNEYVISEFLFHSSRILILFSLVPALISIFRILFKKARLAGLWFSIAVISFVACERIAPKFIKYYDSTHPPPARVCSTNLKCLAMAIEVYSFDFDGKLPTVSEWCDLLKFYADVDEKRFLCPADKIGQSSYAMNKFASSDDVRPDDMVLLFESNPGWNQFGGPGLLNTYNHEGRGAFVLFLNGRQRFIETKDFPTLKWKPDSTDKKKVTE